MKLYRELWKEIVRKDLPLLQSFAELRCGHAHCAGCDLKCAWYTLTKLAAQFFGLHCPFADHLLERIDRSSSLLTRKPKGYGRLGDSLENVSRRLTL
jgi:hypothetical protein